MTFSGCSCHNTTYGYGVANNLGFCKLSAAPVGFIADQSWATDKSAIYGFIDSDDNVCNWFGVGKTLIGPGLNWKTLGLRDQHIQSVGPGWNNVGSHGDPKGIQSGLWHGVLSATSSMTASRICNGTGATSHDATIRDSACDNSQKDAANREAAWRFLLLGN